MEIIPFVPCQFSEIDVNRDEVMVADSTGIKRLVDYRVVPNYKYTRWRLFRRPKPDYKYDRKKFLTVDWKQDDIAIDKKGHKQTLFNRDFGSHGIGINAKSGEYLKYIDIIRDKLTPEEDEFYKERLSYIYRCTGEVCPRNVGETMTGLYFTHYMFDDRGGWVDCMARAKTTESFNVYLPVEYLNLMGYSQQDVEAWIDFLGGIFQSAYKAEYNVIRPNTTLCDYKEDSLQFLRTNMFHKVNVSGSLNRMRTYTRLVVLRYLQDAEYAHIPRLCFDIKEKLPNLSNWQILLMAHTHTRVNAYYSLLWEDSVPRLDQTLTSVMEKASGRQLNDSFKYLNETRLSLVQLWNEFKYKEIYDSIIEIQEKQHESQ